jgi:hypothetical protein
MQKKVCVNCKLEKQIEDFIFEKKSSNYRSTCKKCYNDRVKEKYDTLKKERKMYGYY